MREITSETELVSPSGKLVEAALGFSRRPLHNTENLPRGLRHGWHAKAWDRWTVVTDDVFLILTLADLDVAALVRVFCLDRATGAVAEHEAVKFARPADAMVLPGEVPPFFAHGTLDGLSVRFDAAGENRTVLRAETERVSTVLEVDAHTESLSMATSLGRDRFRYTVTGPALPVTGLVVLDGRDVLVDAPSFATLERGRGLLPRRTESLRACAGGIASDGRRVGLVLTDGPAGPSSDVAENALVINGKLNGPRPQVTWDAPALDSGAKSAPWHARGSWIDATLKPAHTRTVTSKSGLINETCLQAFGEFSGSAVLTDGSRVDLTGLKGWAERSSRRW
ncbi:MAG: DUF2804 domain-containing protein [Galactobacter sp.]